MRYLFYYTFLFSLSFAQFDWKTDGAGIRQGLHIEWQRTGDANADGTMIYAWSDCRNNGVRDVIAQKVDAEGNNLWGDNGVVVVTAEGRQEDPQLVTDGTGGAYIIWMDYRDETDAEGDIYAQHVLSDGSLGWIPEGYALTNQTGQQSSPNICSDGEGGAYVIWKDNANSSYGEIYATHLSVAGNIVASYGVGVPIITYSSYRSSPSLNTGGSGAAVLVWSDDRNADEDLYAQRISVNGNTINTVWGNVGNGGKLVLDAAGDQTSPRVAQYNGDETIITWEDTRSGNTDAYYQILNVSGNEMLTSGGVAACFGEWEIIKPRVKAENAVAYIVWEDRRNGWTSDIYAQKINSSGAILWGNGLAITTTSDVSQTEPRLTTDGVGGVYFVWEDQRNSDETGIDIYAQHVDSNGTILHDANGELICDAENLQFNPLVRNDGNGGALIVWGDQRTGGSYGMYLQHLTSSGTTLTGNGVESFFGISTDAANEPYNHGAVYLGHDNDKALVYWQDNRRGDSKIYGSIISSSYDGLSQDYYTNYPYGRQLSTLELPQELPKAILAGNKIFLSFKVEESPNENLYFQLLNMNLTPNGDAIALADPSTSKQSFDMVFGEDGYIYYAYSENFDVFLQKLNNIGGNVWTQQVVTTNADDIVKAIYPSPSSGCVIIYESQSFIGGSHIYAVEVSESGENQFSVLVSNRSGDQYYESSALTEDGVFISFKDNTSGNYDVYGQHVLFDGNLDFSPSGVAIANDGTDDQQSSSVAYDPDEDIALVCYESYEGPDTDLFCKEINLNDQTVDSEIIISDNHYNQKNPYVYWTGHSFMIAWEDGRNSTDSNPEQDIYFEEVKNGSFILPASIYPSSFDQKQERPIIVKYSDINKFYIIVWEDYRSTGKEFCANLYGQSYYSPPCSDVGDTNYDGVHNVLDIVILANCVLNSSCGELAASCAADMNNDGFWNVLDIVILANCIINQTCADRLDNATASQLIMNGNIVSIEADGFIGGVQMTLTHGDDFTIDMTDRALLADYVTKGNETRLLVITPETDELFSFEGDFEISEIIVANSYAEISVDLPLAANFSLNDAYPNPFNPTTTMELTMPVAGDMQVEVYNLRGQVVATLASGYMDMGTYDLIWDAKDVSSGMYFVKAQADGFTKTQKLMLVK